MATPIRSIWSNKKEDYKLLEVIGYGATAVVQSAYYIPRDEKVAIKRIDLEKCGASIDEMQKEIHAMSQCNHENVVNYFTSFVVKSELWIIMKILDGGSMLDIIKHLSKSKSEDVAQGVLDEVVIATVLREVLKGLEYFHRNGQIHRDVKAGNILLGSDGTVQLADFGVSAALTDYGDRTKPKLRKTFVGTPCWMAPEVMEQLHGYDQKSDIWSFGITAIELATGTAPYARYPAMKVLMLTLQNDPPTLETCADGNKEAYKKYSKPFRKMISLCLQKDPAQRPDASELLKLAFFKKAKGKEFLEQNLLSLAPGLGERAQKVKRIQGSSGRLHRTADGEWEWSDDDSSEKAKEEGSNDCKEVAVSQSENRTEMLISIETEPPPTKNVPKVNVEHEEGVKTEQKQRIEPKVFDITLRLRNSEGELNDIRFDFSTGSDTVDGVAQELVSAGLIDGVDVIVIAANLNKIITSNDQQIVFPLHSYGHSSEQPDDKTLRGFAQFTLN